MFERRLKIFLGLLIVVTVILLLRAAHLQLANGDYWRKQASETLHRRTLVEPVRGRIIDLKNNVLAEDVACIDAAVDYRAIDLDEKWLQEQAISRLAARFGPNYRRAEKSVREKMLRSEEHTSELQSRQYIVCRLLLEKKKNMRLAQRVGSLVEQPVDRHPLGRRVLQRAEAQDRQRALEPLQAALAGVGQQPVQGDADP